MSNDVTYDFVFLFLVLLSFSFFSGDLSERVNIGSISDYIEQYTPELNYYLTPVIVRTTFYHYTFHY